MAIPILISTATSLRQLHRVIGIYPKISESFGNRITEVGSQKEYKAFNTKMRDQLQARVEKVERLTKDIIELTIRAPLAVSRHQPAQIFRLQNFETESSIVNETRLQTETIPLTGSRIDKESGTVSVIIRERGASSRLCATLQPGDPVVLMGPGGNASQIPTSETVMVIGDWLAAAAMRSLGPAYRSAGNKVLLVVTAPSAEDFFCQQDLERVSNTILWVSEKGKPLANIRQQDVAFTGKLTDALMEYAAGRLGDLDSMIALQDVTNLHITADSHLLKEIQRARKQELAEFLVKNPKVTASVYSSMQCMLKGVCSQCLQWQIDPETGERVKAVFACSWQDEPLDIVDIDALNERLNQNRLQERLSNRWFELFV